LTSIFIDRTGLGEPHPRPFGHGLVTDCHKASLLCGHARLGRQA
jgi:hypothetical protein